MIQLSKNNKNIENNNNNNNIIIIIPATTTTINDNKETANMVDGAENSYSDFYKLWENTPLYDIA